MRKPCKWLAHGIPVNGRPMGTIKKPSHEGPWKWGNREWVGMGKWGSPPEIIWWPPVLLIFYLIMTVSITVYSILMDISFIIKAAQTNLGGIAPNLMMVTPDCAHTM